MEPLRSVLQKRGLPVNSRPNMQEYENFKIDVTQE